MTVEERAKKVVDDLPADCHEEYDRVAREIVATAIWEAVVESARGIEKTRCCFGPIVGQEGSTSPGC